MKKYLIALLVCVGLLALPITVCAAELPSAQEAESSPAESGETAEGTRPSLTGDTATDDTATGGVADAASEAPPWQVYLEEKLLPTLLSVASFACSAYILLLPIIKKIVRSCGLFDGAAEGVNLVSESAKGSVSEVKKLREELGALQEELQAREEKIQGLLESGVRMMSLAFSHESELVKNGTAREIMKVVEQYGQDK